METNWLALHTTPERSALLVIDVQNDFCAPGGWYDRVGNDLTSIGPAVAAIESLLPDARAAGILVVFFQCVYGPHHTPVRLLEQWTHRGLPVDLCTEGSWGAELFRLVPEVGDLVLTKHNYSGFARTELESVLRARGIENLILTGVATNVCVDSTARDARMRDYRATVVEDCCASSDPALHEATLENLRRAFGLVVTSAELKTGLTAHQHSSS